LAIATGNSAASGLFDRAGVPPRSLRELRLDLGPGSYTGLRVAVTFARTLQALGDVTVRTATSLELLALRAFTERGVDRDATVRPVLDARRSRFHHAAVRIEEHVALTEPPAAVPLEALLDAIGDRDVLLVDAKVRTHLEDAVKAREGVTLVQDEDQRLAPELLFHPLLAPRITPAEGLEPLYLMGSYAD